MSESLRSKTATSEVDASTELPFGQASNRTDVGSEDESRDRLQPRGSTAFAQHAEQAARCSGRRIACLMTEIFPWRKLHEPVNHTTHRWFQRLTPFSILLAGISIWLLTLLFFGYMFLTLGALSTIEPYGPFFNSAGEIYRRKWQIKAKMPLIGQHYPFFAIGKHLIEVGLLHHLCRNLMQPIPEIQQHRMDHLHAALPHGVLHWCRWVLNKVACRRHNDRWLSSFSIDHIFLFAVGSCGILHQLDMLISKGALLEHTLTYPEGLEPYPWTVVIHSLIAAYVGILMMGFLFTTLEYNVAAAAGKRNEFRLVVTLSLVLWLLDFVIIIMNRTLYMAYWSEPRPIQRIIASMAQIFVTHGSVMLGAVMFGHSSHFHKSPDMTWSTFWTKGFPLLVTVTLYYAYYAWSRSLHTWEGVMPMRWSMIAAPQVYLNVIWRVFGGSVLLYMGYRNRGTSLSQQTEHAAEVARIASLAASETASRASVGAQYNADPQRSLGVAREDSVSPSTQSNASELVVSLIDMLDYDAALILFTGSCSLLYNVNMIYTLKPDGEYVFDPWPFLGQIGSLLAPIGLVVFTLGAWRRPPRRRLGCAYHGLWFALFFAVTQFFVFQVAEDCEISSDMKPCCSYPGFPGWNNEAHRSEMCNKGARCLSRANPTHHGVGEDHAVEVGDFYCSRNISHHGTIDDHHHELRGLRTEVADMRAQLQMICGQLVSAGASPELRARCLLQVPNATWKESDAASATTGRRMQGIGECCCCDESRHNKAFHCDPGRWAGEVESSCPTKPGGKITEKCRDELYCRWQVFQRIGGTHEEVEEHEETMSTPYILFETWGTAASIEMYFTICGVLLKVILLTQHPNSEEILELAAHHHRVDHTTKEHSVVAVRRGEMMGTVTWRSQASPTSLGDPTEGGTFTAVEGRNRQTSSLV